MTVFFVSPCTYATDTQRQAVVTLKIYNPGLDCLGATHSLTLRNPFWFRPTLWEAL